MPQVRNNETERERLTAKYRGGWEANDADPNAFKELIQQDPCVCDNCFLLRYEEESFEWSQGELGWMEYNRWHAIPDRSTEVPADGTGTRLACANCGHRNSKRRPLPKHRIREVIANLSLTLDAKGIDHDPLVLASEVEERNTSDVQGKQDSDVFAPAVEAAITTIQTEGRPRQAPIR